MPAQDALNPACFCSKNLPCKIHNTGLPSIDQVMVLLQNQIKNLNTDEEASIMYMQAIDEASNELFVEDTDKL